MSNKAIPVQEARDLSEKYEKDQIIIFAYDEAAGDLNFVTYGATEEHGHWAHKNSQKVARILGLSVEEVYENYLDDKEYQNSKPQRQSKD